MIKIIRKLLLQIVDNIDTGNTNLTEEESIETLKVLSRLVNKTDRLSKYSACKYLNISRAKFDNLVREGKLPRGKHDIGFKELSWNKKELDEYIKKLKYDNSKKNGNSHI